ncbi:SDR family oxidoreductase [Streptacidiphilus sp. ASG 303]|uniref:SDR family NAD(P)-dependent oxidoreductase n=1 Tax=Streptacidiphilus sp. ASG 303 TaxID=2896847 RepID=UPI001E34A31A|nr:SDR family oxidoreductase [Streptacidiphilus sp. ASG 303]MCD0484178.1 SDR family oxidoreductase [Streptacidiphilus sp. ASG 303]
MARVVVISGGGTGIGFGVAEAFAADGEQLVLVGRRAEVLDRAAARLRTAFPGIPAPLAVAADLADPAGAEHAAKAVGERWDRVDVLVNSAGGNAALGAPADRTGGLAGTAWHWEQNFRANTLTAVLLTEALKDRLATPGGRVVLVSSIAAYRGSGSGSYGGSKAALHPYAYDLSAELGPRGVTVNVVAPGYVADTEFFRGALSAERERTLVAQTDTGRAGLPEDVAATVRWLASPEAGQITAQVVQVNGGAERGR